LCAGQKTSKKQALSSAWYRADDTECQYDYDGGQQFTDGQHDRLGNPAIGDEQVEPEAGTIKLSAPTTQALLPGRVSSFLR